MFRIFLGLVFICARISFAQDTRPDDHYLLRVEELKTQDDGDGRQRSGIRLPFWLNGATRTLMRSVKPARTVADLVKSKPYQAGISKGLIVFLHGLRALRLQFAEGFELAERLVVTREFDIWAPSLLNGGNAAYTDVLPPLEKQLAAYVRRFPHNPLVIISTSNGARLGLQLLPFLRRLTQDNPIFFASIAGAHYGSRLVSEFRPQFLVNWALRAPMREELRFGNALAKAAITT